eukprot:3043948-Rhodomonas_salina.2
MGATSAGTSRARCTVQLNSSLRRLCTSRYEILRDNAAASCSWAEREILGESDFSALNEISVCSLELFHVLAEFPEGLVQGSNQGFLLIMMFSGLCLLGRCLLLLSALARFPLEVSIVFPSVYIAPPALRAFPRAKFFEPDSEGMALPDSDTDMAHLQSWYGIFTANLHSHPSSSAGCPPRDAPASLSERNTAT